MRGGDGSGQKRAKDRSDSVGGMDERQEREGACDARVAMVE
jgi:hypothetical protein